MSKNSSPCCSIVRANQAQQHHMFVHLFSPSKPMRAAAPTIQRQIANCIYVRITYTLGTNCSRTYTPDSFPDLSTHVRQAQQQAMTCESYACRLTAQSTGWNQGHLSSPTWPSEKSFASLTYKCPLAVSYTAHPDLHDTIQKFVADRAASFSGAT